MKALSPDSLTTIDGSLSVPFTLTLSPAAGREPDTYECHELLRVLPGRRQVIRAELRGERVVLKLFTGRGRTRYLARERRGLGWLAEAGVPIAEVLEDIQDAEVVGLTLRHLPDARVIGPHDQLPLEEIARLLGRMHAIGVWHTDLHLDNFLLADGRVHAIDGDGVRRRRRSLDLARGLGNLAVLAAQRPPIEDDRLAGLLDGYGRGRKLAPGHVDDFLTHLQTARFRRIRRYLKKTGRSCTEFAVTRGWRARSFAVRGPGEAALAELRRNPENAFDSGHILKAGNSATIVRPAGAPGLVIKRFNIKNLRHGLRRMLRPVPRFRRAWQSGQLLHFLEIPTARPLALLEQRIGPWRGVAYLVMEDLGEFDLAAEVAASGLSDDRCREIVGLFQLLKRAGLSHGDTKASNFLIQQDRVHLIDLDGTRTDRAGLDRDIHRFLDNWQTAEKLRFQAAFESAGLL